MEYTKNDAKSATLSSVVLIATHIFMGYVLYKAPKLLTGISELVRYLTAQA